MNIRLLRRVTRLDAARAALSNLRGLKRSSSATLGNFSPQANYSGTKKNQAYRLRDRLRHVESVSVRVDHLPGIWTTWYHKIGRAADNINRQRSHHSLVRGARRNDGDYLRI